MFNSKTFSLSPERETMHSPRFLQQILYFPALIGPFNISRLFSDIRPETFRAACLNLLTPNDDYNGRTAPLTSKRCILYIYSTHIGTEYFKHVIYSPFFPIQNAVCFIIRTYLVPGLFTFYIQVC